MVLIFILSSHFKNIDVDINRKYNIPKVIRCFKLILYDVCLLDKKYNIIVERHIEIEKLITNPIALKNGVDTNKYKNKRYNMLVMIVFMTNFFSLFVATNSDTKTPSK